MNLQQRSRQRKQRIVAHRAHSFADAEQWDLEFWQRQSPAQRLTALVAIHVDVRAVTGGRRKSQL